MLDITVAPSRVARARPARATYPIARKALRMRDERETLALSEVSVTMTGMIGCRAFSVPNGRFACPSCGSLELAAVERATVDYAARFSRASDGTVQVEYTGEFTVLDEATEPTGQAWCRSCCRDCSFEELVPAIACPQATAAAKAANKSPERG
jgi:hypothetical protein